MGMTVREIRKHLSGFTVGIAGAGGLGSNCAVALARSGIGRLIICDFDVVEPSNLNRQYFFADQEGMLKTVALKENIYRIDPLVTVIIHNEKLDRGNIFPLFSGCHVIVEALDLAATKEMFIETIQTLMPGIPLIAGSGVAGWGRTDDIHLRRLDKSLYVCGDESVEVSDDNPVMAPRVGIVANMQANTAIDILMSMKRR
jgi:sulfur carrier protein ThiS adenylyltransferase